MAPQMGLWPGSYSPSGTTTQRQKKVAPREQQELQQTSDAEGQPAALGSAAEGPASTGAHAASATRPWGYTRAFNQL